MAEPGHHRPRSRDKPCYGISRRAGFRKCWRDYQDRKEARGRSPQRAGNQSRRANSKPFQVAWYMRYAYTLGICSTHILGRMVYAYCNTKETLNEEKSFFSSFRAGRRLNFPKSATRGIGSTARAADGSHRRSVGRQPSALARERAALSGSRGIISRYDGDPTPPDAADAPPPAITQADRVECAAKDTARIF